MHLQPLSACSVPDQTLMAGALRLTALFGSAMVPGISSSVGSKLKLPSLLILSSVMRRSEKTALLLMAAVSEGKISDGSST